MMGVLQYLLIRCERDGGIIFAPRINELPLSRTFLYQYFPTIVAVVFSIHLAWVDLDTKRIEPFYQMSQEGGALGQDSLLLHYPYDFIPLVPLTAFRRRHWSVFYASLAVVITTWGVVPIQAGIFATSTITRLSSASTTKSTGYLPSARQASELSLRYVQSVYGIATLNETLPPYMTRAYTLAPFKARSSNLDRDELWTAPTTLYSLDMECEEARPKGTNSWTDSHGCTTIGLNTNQTIGRVDASGEDAGVYGVREYSAMYVGYWNLGMANYYIAGSCPREFSNRFYAGFGRNKRFAADPPIQPTSTFCHASYYQQEVNATISSKTKHPIGDVVPLGPKRPLSDDIFNITLFEGQLNDASPMQEVRGALPDDGFPSYAGRIAYMNITLTEAGSTSGGWIHTMAALAIISGNKSLENYLEIDKLRLSYEAAYRLMFSRAMHEVLDQDFASTVEVEGTRRVTTQTVLLVPVFTYIAEALLGVVSLATLGLWYCSSNRSLNLRTDPSTFASVMSLTASEQSLLEYFEQLDLAPDHDMDERINSTRYSLTEHGISMMTKKGTGGTTDSPIFTFPQEVVAKPVKPFEFRSFISLPFIILHVIMAVLLAVLFFKGRANGFPHPSKNKLVQNLIQNYIPTAIATLIEPIWLMINRVSCQIQQLEELRKGATRAERSIDLNYGSFPPQLALFKALRSKHLLLAAVCSMALLANVLAVAFADLFDQDIRYMDAKTEFEVLLRDKVVAMNGSIGPGFRAQSKNASGAWKGGDGSDQFLVAESNITNGTPLPPWTDHKMMYIPFASGNRGNELYKTRTAAFGSTLECGPLISGLNYTAILGPPWDPYNDQIETPQLYLSTTALSSSGETATCFGGTGILTSLITEKWDPPNCTQGQVALEVIMALQARENATKQELDACAGTVAFGWIREPHGTCGMMRNRTLDESNSLFVGCVQKLEIGDAMVLVDSKGFLQQPAEDLELIPPDDEERLEKHFTTAPLELIKQSSQYLFDKFPTPRFHQDTYASHAINYFVRARIGSKFLDPTQPPPTFEEVQKPLNDVYRFLFATWLGINKENLFDARGENKTLIQGWAIRPTERIFLSTPMFVIAESILGCYVIVAVLVYIRRPGQYLARLPTTLAAMIAMFAASAAVQDMQGTSAHTRKERSHHLKRLDHRYGYGSYIGTDGKIHVGIEKVPRVAIKTNMSWWQRKTSNV